MNTMVSEQGQNLNFALPIDHIREALKGELKVRGSIAQYAQFVETQNQRETERSAAKADLVRYTDPEGLYSLTLPKSWVVRRNVQTDQETGSTHITMMAYSRDAEHAKIDGWLSKGLRISMEVFANRQSISEEQRAELIEVMKRAFLDSYDNGAHTQETEQQLNGTTVVALALSGESKLLKEPEALVLYMLVNEYGKMTIELVAPAREAQMLQALNQTLLRSFTLKASQASAQR